MNKHINHNLTHCCYTIDPKYTVLVHCTPHVQVSRKGVHVIILLLSICLLEDLIIWSTILIKITCVMKHWHQQDFLVFVTWENLLMNHSLYYFIMRIEIWKTIVGNPWSVALHLPPVGHNTKYFGEQNILLNSLKCMTFFWFIKDKWKSPSCNVYTHTQW